MMGTRPAGLLELHRLTTKNRRTPLSQRKRPASLTFTVNQRISNQGKESGVLELVYQVIEADVSSASLSMGWNAGFSHQFESKAAGMAISASADVFVTGRYVGIFDRTTGNCG
jgi:hypothetical protein